MKRWQRYLQGTIFLLAAAQARAQNLQEKDLAIVLDKSPTQAVRFQNAGANELFPSSWYQQVLQSFRTTPVGTAIERENRFGDWQLVAVRVAPCMSIGQTPGDNISEHCWPEVRLVWQPIVQGFADDRAIHATYDVFPSDALTQDELNRAVTLRNRLYQYYRGSHDASVLLNTTEEAEYRTLRNKVVNRMLGNTLWLRLLTGGYGGHGPRPEAFSNQAAAFRERLLLWLQAYAPARLLKELTAFSLPAGRSPGNPNIWSFIAFDAQSGQITPRSLQVQSLRDGRPLINLGNQENVSNQNGDSRISLATMPAATAAELRETVIFNAFDRNRLLPRLADRNQILVPNTTCSSCHRFSNDGNNFHNMSYFIGFPQMSIADRVQRDVAWDLNWILSHR